MMTHDVDVEAHINFCPESRHMTIRFSGGECTGMPPFSSELLDLALGAHKVTFDLTGLRLTHPQTTVDLILSALGTDRDDPNVEVVLSESTPGDPLQGSYYVG